MTKKRVIVGFIIVALLSLLFLAYTNSQYAIVWNVNRGINVDGVRLMTTNRNVKRILGEEGIRARVRRIFSSTRARVFP